MASSSPRIVVLGSGWAGFSFAKAMASHMPVTLVSPRNHMLFTPLLASTSVGTLEFRSIAEPVRNIKGNITYTQAKWRGIDVDAKEITIRTEQPHADPADKDARDFATLPYDALVIAVGARSNTFNVPGVFEHAMFMKELSDARRVRARILECLEKAAFPSTPDDERKQLLTFVVVGGGPTGVEFSAELSDFLSQDIRRTYPDLMPFVSIKLIEGRDILGMFDEGLRAWAKRRLSKEGVSLVQDNVSCVTDTSVTLSDGTVVPCGLTVWATGNAPRKAVSQLPDGVFSKNRTGQLIVDDCLRVLGPDGSTPVPNVYGVGDAVVVGAEVPKFAATAQVAEQQALTLARSFVASPDAIPSATVPLTPFVYHHGGSLAYIGSYGAVNDFTTMDKTTLLGKVLGGLRLKDWLAWFVWRSAYLTKQGSWRNRLQVPFDWARTLLFGRDISRF